MTLLTYEIFRTVLDCGSFAKAADTLHLTPSAVSHSIASMEDEVGFPLFIRLHGGVRLTPSGKEIAPYIKELLSVEENLNQRIEKIKGLEAGSVKLGTVNTVCTAWIPKILKTFRKNYPHITTEIYQGSYTDVINWERNGTIDIGIISEAGNDGLPFTPLYRDPLVVAVPKGYMPVGTETISPEDLKDRPFVIQSDGSDEDILRVLHSFGLTVRANCRIIDDQSLMAMVECGEGVSIIPALQTESVNAKVDFFPLFPEQYRTLGIITNTGRMPSPAAESMKDTIFSFVAGLGREPVIKHNYRNI